jgi:hypothetical protein
VIHFLELSGNKLRYVNCFLIYLHNVCGWRSLETFKGKAFSWGENTGGLLWKIVGGGCVVEGEGK